MIAQYNVKMPVANLCQWAGVPMCSLYYKSGEVIRDIRPTTHTTVGGALVENKLVVDQIRALLKIRWDTILICLYL